MEKDQLPSKTPFRGVWVALATPFNTEGKVCFSSFEKLLDLQIAAGVDGFVPLGTTGETPTLESEEREQILKMTVQKARQHGKGVIAGCGSNNTREVIAHLAEAADAGCDGALVITPYYNKPTQEGICQHFLAAANASRIPIVLYHSQGRTGVSISLETFGKLFEHPRIVGVKEASGNHSSWLSLAEHFGKSGKSLLSGDDDMMATFCAMGSVGIISASCNVFPKAFVKLWKAVEERQWETAFEIQLAILPAVRAMFAETNPGPIKYALAQQGIGTNALRLPLVTVKRSTEALVAEALQGLRKRDLL